MMMKTIYLLYLIVTLVVIVGSTYGQNVSNSTECQKRINNNERAIRKILLLSNELTIPRSVADVNTYCRAAKEGIKTNKKSLPCFTAFPKQLFQVLISAFNKLYLEMCGKTANKQDSVRKLRCITPEVVTKAYDCMYDATKHLDYVATNTSEAQLFPYLCCTIHKVSQCAYDKIFQTCGEGRQDGATFLKMLIEKAFSDIVTIICAKTPKLDVCLKDEVEAMKVLDIVGKLPFRDPSRTFFIRPLLDLADRLVE